MSLMIRISKAASIALHALAFISGQKRDVNVSELSTICGASLNHTQKVCQRLVKSGILIARRGPGGGYGLNRKSDDIILMEIYELFDGNMVPDQCPFGQATCEEGDPHECIFGERMMDINHRIFKYFTQTKLSDIATNCNRVLGK